MVFTTGEQGASDNVTMPEALGQSEVFFEFQEKISKVAPVERPVLILGERGTGKELAASRLHFLSKRWQKPVVTLNCSALTPTLIGSELFGYEKGAFTGARGRQVGRFEKANQGTLFLDEIGTIPMEVQEKILRVVEYGSFERVGSSRSVNVDVRIVAATNADLPLMATQGRFKQDLLDRLSFEVIYVPPLRDRKEDIMVLASHFAGRMAFELGWEMIPEFSPSAVKTLQVYDWPGNIRELKNVVERAVYKSAGGKISEIVFDPFDSPYGKRLFKAAGHHAGVDSAGPSFMDENSKTMDQRIIDIMDKPFKEAVSALELSLLKTALSECRYNQKKAAKKLSLSYDQLRGLVKKHKKNLKNSSL